MRIDKLAYGIVLLVLVLTTACNKPETSWSCSETELIERYSDTIMPLKRINNESDSLLLRQKSSPLTFEDVKSGIFNKLANQMLLTVNDPNDDGVGIAAPQVGVNRQLIAVQRIDKEGEPFEIFINPQIISVSDSTQRGWEGCLSVPDKRGLVKRHKQIIIRHNSHEKFESVTDTITGFTAVIFQHEIDHLDGILYIDRADSITIK